MDKPFVKTDQLAADYLKPGQYIDSDHSAVKAFALLYTSSKQTDQEKAVSIYYAIRDGFKYNPYQLDLTKFGLKASSLLLKDNGYCVEKACLMAACSRALGIPARLGFGIVKNHLGVERILESLKTDLLVFHGYVEIWLNNRWVKATPVFNRALCEMYKVEPLAFDGTNDSLFQQYATDGDYFMEYIHDYGQFDDIPRDLFIDELQKHYPHIFEANAQENYRFKVLVA